MRLNDQLKAPLRDAFVLRFLWASNVVVFGEFRIR